MVSRLWKHSAVDELIEKATAETKLSGHDDLDLQLHISDRIRSNKMAPHNAMLSMKKRLAHRNPNVQLSTLSLLDTCVKNGGEPFIKEVAAREWMDELVRLVRLQTTNHDVRQKILSLIQLWGMAAKDYPALAYVADIYALLRAEGHPFSPVQQCSHANLFEANAAPTWTDSDVCERCRCAFTLTNRKHHCRNCGGTFCQPCSSHTLALPNLAMDDPVRVCDGCYAKTRDKGKKEAQLISSDTTARNEAHDLEQAIALSLQNAPSPALPYDEDADLVKAVAASLREMEVSNPPERNPHVPTDPSPSAPSAPPAQLEHGLTCQDMENIQLFATLMAHHPPVHDPQIQRLYTQIATLQPKMVHSLEAIIQRHRSFVELHDKINQAIRQYEHCLQQRMASLYGQPYPSTSFPLTTAPSVVPSSSTKLSPSSATVSTPPSTLLDDRPLIEL
ncbi:hypothetical protein DM01DRAFT_1336541 [Hesseltinella vesiculosa]|uniref:Vacuolar protein sorting-associated protein 27 n=1 Tax=Hesseltinella vesiculosa TaxID=101127 RepID=A0A1X2GFS5_9FUNG|nr:hypothetical protein DM01DRAFT_1336541 [Hesseltinella vesiculosa]